MTNLEALIELYIALGGQASDLTANDTNANIIDKIATKATSMMGRLLPVVTAADNGKVLMVTNGAWEVASLPEEELPAVTAADNGKVLMVKSGAWDAGVIPDELPEVTVEENGQVLKVVEGVWAVATEGTN